MKVCTGCTDPMLLSPDFPVRMVVCQNFVLCALLLFVQYVQNKAV